MSEFAQSSEIELGRALSLTHRYALQLLDTVPDRRLARRNFSREVVELDLRQITEVASTLQVGSEASADDVDYWRMGWEDIGGWVHEVQARHTVEGGRHREEVENLVVARFIGVIAGKDHALYRPVVQLSLDVVPGPRYLRNTAITAGEIYGGELPDDNDQEVFSEIARVRLEEHPEHADTYASFIAGTNKVLERALG